MAASLQWLVLAVVTPRVVGYSPDYKYLDEHCGSSSVLPFSKDVLVDYSSYRSSVPAHYSCQLSLQARHVRGLLQQVQVHFRFLNTLQSPGCSVVGLRVSEGSTSLTPQNGVCGSVPPSVNYRTKGDTVTLQLINTGELTYVEFELLLTSFHYVDRNNSCSEEDDFACDNGICISSDLTCNGFNDCGDDSDELEGCSLTAGIIVAIVFGGICVLAFFCVFLVCLRRRRRMYLRLSEESQEMLIDHIHALAARCEMLEIEQELLKTSLRALQERSEWQDSFIRRHNLLFFGIPRTVKETHDQCQAKVLEVIRTAMNVAERVQVERVHRLGSSAVLVRFLTVKDKRLVLAHGQNLRGKNVRISDDFSPRVREIRKGLTELKNTYVAEGKTAWLRYDKLYTQFDVFTFDLETKTVKKVRPKKRGGHFSGQYLTLTSVQRVSPVEEETAYPCSSGSEG